MDLGRSSGSSHDEVFRLDYLAEDRGLRTARSDALVYCLSLVSEVEEAMDLDGFRDSRVGCVLLGDALCVWALI